MTKTVAPLILIAGQNVNTQLTPNSNTDARATFDLNDTTYVNFYYQNYRLYWVTLVSIATTEVSLQQDVGNNIVTFCRGLTVLFSAQGPEQYQVFLDGKIIDEQKVYSIKGQSLGVFKRGQHIRHKLVD
ncbi:MAG: hypothetical protein F6J92_03400 [Symploca sp. SIO1A3]|nr:hypothetical protein [Symploca sp. SIO1A3]